MPEHCVKVPIVYDWITIDDKISKCKFIPVRQSVKEMEDCICINFNVNCQNNFPTTIWQAVGDTVNAATFSIEHKGSCSCDLIIFANDEEIAQVSESNTFSGTIGELEKLSVLCANGCGDEINCEAMLTIVVHYLICEEANVDDNPKEVSCFLSDENGDPIRTDRENPFVCREISRSITRRSETFHTSRSGKISLQKVSILLEGHVTVKIVNASDDCVVLCTFPISIMKTVLLCAPEGTQVKCSIDQINCSANIIDENRYKNCWKVCLNIDFCLSVQSFYKAIVHIEGNLCEPRKDIRESVYNCY
ncbi:S-Ena type endospore appendage [Gracilibacillus saliphilus]|uniref:S-Ena type endospore appendage n=1 Tax=Gracilibacillus saliphilus TaxID=543890 RepID=UPI0013D26E80|nr:S-Ena type endospore appendage [Gracilibacillus saliphilus]